MQNLDSLKLRLEKETYPTLFIFKFIGKKTGIFQDAALRLEVQFPDLTSKGQKLSGNEKHISYTFALNASSADAIIQIYEAIAKLPDLVIVL